MHFVVHNEAKYIASSVTYKLNSLFAAREHAQDRARPDVTSDKNTKQ